MTYGDDMHFKMTRSPPKKTLREFMHLLTVLILMFFIHSWTHKVGLTMLNLFPAGGGGYATFLGAKHITLSVRSSVVRK